jgi:hypothetical protein
MMLRRRALLGTLLAAPAIVRTPGLLMAIKPPVVIVPIEAGQLLRGFYARIEEAQKKFIAENIYEKLLALAERYPELACVPDTLVAPPAFTAVVKEVLNDRMGRDS